MTGLRHIRGPAAPLLHRNIDTDTIAPGLRLSQVGRRQVFSEKATADSKGNLFAAWRYDEQDRERPDFVLNRPGFREARFLLTGANFGCGSSRESAVWLLRDFGILCIVAPSFGEIFYNNCFKNGVLPIVLDEAAIAALAEESEPGGEQAVFTADIEARTLAAPSGATVTFTAAAFRLEALMQGRDELAQTLTQAERIADYLSAARRDRPWAFPETD